MDSDHVVFMKKICVSGHIEVKSMFKGQLYFENMYHVDWVLSCILQLGKFIVSRVSVSCKQGFEGGTVDVLGQTDSSLLQGPSYAL